MKLHVDEMVGENGAEYLQFNFLFFSSQKLQLGCILLFVGKGGLKISLVRINFSQEKGNVARKVFTSEFLRQTPHTHHSDGGKIFSWVI